MKSRDILAVFNRGRISRLAVARTDVSRVALSASIQTNWMPRTLGSMMLRPGLQYHGANLDDGALIPFIYQNNDKAILELTPSAMRIWDDGDALVTRSAVTATVTNGTFDTDLTGWTDADDSGTTSAWATGGYMSLLGTKYASARRRQEVTVTETTTPHALRIVIERGPLYLRVGTTAGDDDIFRQAVLRTGTHSIAFTPNAASFFIELSSPITYPVLVDSCEVEGAGVVSIPTPWTDADTCRLVRWHQSADVLFCACAGLQPHRVERRPDNSWSVVAYEPIDGPFQVENVDSIRFTPSAIAGEITIASTQPYFQDSHVGALFSESSQGQIVQASLSANSTFTDPVVVTGTGSARHLSVTRAGTWVGTLRLQRSVGAPGAWINVASYTTNGTATYDDNLDNQIIYYRIGFDTGYTSGTADVELDISTGSITGVVRITEVTDSQNVSAIVVKPLGGIIATEVWAEGSWSDLAGWPEAVAGYEGRMWWSGTGRVWASASDAFASFDPDIEGDSAPINRQAGDGQVAKINWLLPLQRLVIGTDSAEYAVRSNSFDEPITRTNYNAKASSTKGSAAVASSSSDGRGYFIGKATDTLFELEYDVAKYDYTALELTLLVPEIGDGGFKRIAVQQSPDRRVHAVRNDGTVGVLVRDAAEDVMCWVDVETDGLVEDVVVLPGTYEDRVFYRVSRTIDGSTVRYLEEWAQESECVGGTLNKQADSFVTGTGPTATLTGLDHLEGEEVVVWADGADQGSYTVSGGSVTLASSVTSWVAGLGYQARYKSAKLAGQTGLGLSLTQRSRVNKIGLILADTHADGLQYGPDFDTLDDLPLVENGTDVVTGAIWDSYDEDMIEFPGDWDTDNRLCLVANAPRPCTVLAAVLNVDRQDTN